jgi:endonuclease YncB( thermonuclease family)
MWLGLLVALLVWVLPVRAEDLTGVEYVSCYDGDTCTVHIPTLPAIFGHRLAVRLAGLDTPELKGRCEWESYLGWVAKAMLNAKMRQAKHIVLHDVKPDKYFRVDAIVLADGVNLNQYMLESGLARPYAGGTRRSWCP